MASSVSVAAPWDRDPDPSPIHLAGLVLTAAPEGARRPLLAALEERREAGDFASAAWVTGEGSVPLLPGPDGEADRAPVAALQLAEWIIDHPLGEVDALVRPLEGDAIAATAWHDASGRITVQLGAAPIDLGEMPDVTPRSLGRRFGIGALEDSDTAAWSAYERKVLAMSLELLSKRERRFLRNLPFVREVAHDGAPLAGIYVRDEASPSGRIAIFDRAFESDDRTIAGSPDAARPGSCHTILHEIAHAIAKLHREALLQQHQSDVQIYNELVERYNLFGRALASGRLARKRHREIGAERRKLGRTLKDAKKLFKQRKRAIEGPSPMEEAFAELPGALPGPTEYGRTSRAEAFAEAFALHRLDPASLRRISPAAADWFEAEGHLDAAHYPGLTRTVTDSRTAADLE